MKIWEHDSERGANYYAAFDEDGHFKEDTHLGLVRREDFDAVTDVLALLSERVIDGDDATEAAREARTILERLK